MYCVEILSNLYEKFHNEHISTKEYGEGTDNNVTRERVRAVEEAHIIMCSAGDLFTAELPQPGSTTLALSQRKWRQLATLARRVRFRIKSFVVASVIWKKSENCNVALHPTSSVKSKEASEGSHQ